MSWTGSHCKTCSGASHAKNIDCCNALFAGLPTSTIAPLQRVQNAAARLVIQLGPRDHVTQGLRELHLLPIQAPVLYKLYVLMYDVHVGNSPSYIRDIVTTCRSATTDDIADDS